MRLKFLIPLLIFVVVSLAGVGAIHQASRVPGNGITNADVQNIYNNLQKYTGLPGTLPALVIQDNPLINAWISEGGLVITTGIIKFVKNKDQLAAIIGHEMGHYMLGHLRNELTDDSRMHEANCDKIGIELMLRAGYNPCEAREVWLSFDEWGGDPILTSTHPSPAQRAWQLDFPMCHY